MMKIEPEVNKSTKEKKRKLKVHKHMSVLRGDLKDNADLATLRRSGWEFRS